MCGLKARWLRSWHGMVVRHALADNQGTMQDAKMALVVEGQLTGKAVEEFNGLTVVKCLKIPK